MVFLNPTAAWHARMAYAEHHSAMCLCVAQGEPFAVLSSVRAVDVESYIEQAHCYAQQGYWVVGWLSYDAAPVFDPAFTVFASDQQRPLVHFHVYREEQVRVEVLTAFPSKHVYSAIQPWCDEQQGADFLNHLEQIKTAIHAGEFYQINLTTRLHSSAEGLDTWALFQTLFLAQPAQHSVYMRTSVGDVLSLSPELFFEWNGSEIKTAPMKGTRRLPVPPTNVSLKDSTKDCAENVMIVDLLRNDLSKICEPKTVQVRSLFDIVQLPTVEQMTSTIVGHTLKNTRLVDVFKALFPCGSVTGAPKIQAMKRIAQWEHSSRHLYCGALGVMHQQHVHFNVPIRTVWAEQNEDGVHQLEYGVGSGITWYSETLAEKREWWQKTAFLRQSTQDFQLLETVRLEHGVWYLYDLHLERMRRAAEHFSFVWDEALVCAQLLKVPVAYQHGVFRGRWLLQADGALCVEFHPMPQPVGSVTIRLAEVPIELTQPRFVQYKTTYRSYYDSFLEQAGDAFDVLLYTPDGEITETCRFNVVLMLDGQLWTPASDPQGKPNLLAGVYRATLLRDNIIRQRALRVEELSQASGMWLINSLRGWVSVVQVITPSGAVRFPISSPPCLIQQSKFMRHVSL